MSTTTVTASRVSVLRRHRGALLIGAGLLAATVFAVIGNGGQQHAGVADPQNRRPEGSQALARVLEGQGIDVRIVRSADAFEQAPMSADTTVVVTSPENLGSSTVQRLQHHVGEADLVVVEPRDGAARLFGESDSSPVERSRTSGDCSDLRFRDLAIDVDAATAYPASSVSCFGTSAGPLLVEPFAGLTLLGSADLIRNEQITRADNAAVALRLLGAHDHLVWYVPDVRDLSAGDGVTLGSLLPDWLRPALVLSVVAVLSVLWWRGRRLGRLAVEPLPVVVTAIESTRSRARLYRKANDRRHAADALRTAARRRLVEILTLPRAEADDPEGLVRDLAPYTHTDHGRLLELLSPGGAAPGTDHELIRLAEDLADLMREVRER